MSATGMHSAVVDMGLGNAFAASQRACAMMRGGVGKPSDIAALAEEIAAQYGIAAVAEVFYTAGYTANGTTGGGDTCPRCKGKGEQWIAWGDSESELQRCHVCNGLGTVQG